LLSFRVPSLRQLCIVKTKQMKRFILLLARLWMGLAGYGQTGTVVINVQQIQSDKGGEISAGIFKKENFPKVGKQMIGTERPVTGSSMQIVFEKVLAGEYGLVAFQDIDKNKDLKTNFVGFPKEPIGFSNDAKIKLGPPDFDDAKVKVEAGKTLTLTITLK
jgi:uncharacterized protein (DUF2141 family)